jgi:GNAT superfamily N-acetyltransferase
MQLAVRPATAEDGALLARWLDAAYGAGYSPTLDRDGPPQPNDLWWVQSEKDVAVVEVNRRPAGVAVVGRQGGRWLVEELLVPGAGDLAARAQEALVQRVGAHLTAQFRRGRQAGLLLRAAETNPFALAVGRHLQAAFANALVVYRHRGARRPSVRPPDGYTVRPSGPPDARAIGRLVREVIPDRGRADEIERLLGTKDGRGYAALRDEVLVGFAAVEVRPGRGGWVVGVRDSHRRRGGGRALAHAAIGALAGRDAPPYATAWALDPVAGAFLRALGFGVERTFLYLERDL